MIIFPAWFVRWKILLPQAKVAKGTVDGICLALKKGWAINLDGGYTHATRSSGSLFNIYPDISLAIHFARKWHPVEAGRIMVINTSCMQANGVARDWPKDRNVYILDIFDPQVDPKDIDARVAIRSQVTVGKADNDESYITKVRHYVDQALSSFAPDLVIYVAGYDVLAKDKKGKMSIDESVIILRDEIVFREVFESQGVPILMTVKACYQKKVEEVVTRSIRNLVVKFELSQKLLQVSSAGNMKVANKLMNKIDRVSQAKEGYTGTTTSLAGRGRKSGVAIAPTMMGHKVNSIKEFEVEPIFEDKFDDVFSHLRDGLYDPSEIGKMDRFSQVK